MSRYKYKVSVCVPVYNVDAYLDECVKSLVSQTLKGIELIFVNDGSTDQSLAILNKYAKKYNNIVVIDQENQGLGGARNKGLSVARGKYIGFVDADDMVEPSMYEKLFLAAEKGGLELAMCDVKIFPEGAKKNKWYTPYRGKIDGDFLHRNTQPWNKIVSRSLLRRINFHFFEKNGDGMFVIPMLHANGVLSIDEPLYLYRAGHASMSTTYNMNNFVISVMSCQEQNRVFEASPYAKNSDLKEYFEFRMIYSLLQAISVAAYLGEPSHFNQYTKMLRAKNYAENEYTRGLLKREFGKLKYYGMVHILPLNYRLSRAITRLIM